MNSTPQEPMHLTVLAFERMTADIARIVVGFPDGRILPPAEAGSHVDVTLYGPNGPFQRAYYVVNPDAAPRSYELAVQRDPHGHGGSVQIHQLTTGTRLSVSFPVSAFGLVPHAKHHVLIAGSVGFAPIVAMARALATRNASFRLLHSSRFGSVPLCFQQSVPIVGMRRDSGRLSLRSAVPRYRLGSHLYVCGPHRLLMDVLKAASLRGWPSQAVHVSTFVPTVQQHGNASLWVRADAREKRCASAFARHTHRPMNLVRAAVWGSSCGPNRKEGGACRPCMGRALAHGPWDGSTPQPNKPIGMHFS